MPAHVRLTDPEPESYLEPFDVSPPSPEEGGLRHVKGGVKLDQWGGEKVDQSTGWMGLSLKDLRGWRERRPANRLAGRV